MSGIYSHACRHSAYYMIVQEFPSQKNDYDCGVFSLKVMHSRTLTCLETTPTYTGSRVLDS